MTEVVIKCQGNSTAKLGELNIIQGHLKELTDKNYSKLKNQILKNGFVAPFFTWSKVNGQPKAKDLLDGTQRKLTLLRMLDEKISMPEDFPIVEIDAPDEKAAKKIILALSSQYGKLSEESLFEFSHDLLDFEELSDSFEFDAIEMEHFEKNFYDKPIGEIEGEDDVPEDAPTISKLGDIWHLGNHRILCGDCTIEENVKRLMGEEKADMMFLDPPYGMNLDTDYSSLSNEEGKSNKYERVIGDGKDFSPDLILSIFKNFPHVKEKFIFGADYFSEYLPNKNDGSWIVWDKRENELTGKNVDGRIGSMFELCWSEKKHHRKIARIMWAGMFGIKDDSKRVHPTQKPVQLAEWFFDNWGKDSKVVVDLFLGSGSTLIACEKTNRKCFGMEISEAYTDVIVKRFADFTHQSDNIYLERDGEKIPYTQLLKQ